MSFEATKNRSPFWIKTDNDFKDEGTVHLHHAFTNEQGEHVKRKAEVPFTTGKSVEGIIRVIIEFEDACNPERLNLTTASQCFSFFRECLKEDARAKWDDFKNNYPLTIAGWEEASLRLVEAYVDDAAIQEQENYLVNVRKPVGLSVRGLSARVRQINRYMAYLPPRMREPPFDENRLKTIFFGICPTDWQDRFKETHRVSDFDFESIEQFMVQQAALAETRAARRNRVTGRGGGRQGRGSRGFSGRSDRPSYSAGGGTYGGYRQGLGAPRYGSYAPGRGGGYQGSSTQQVGNYQGQFQGQFQGQNYGGRGGFNSRGSGQGRGYGRGFGGRGGFQGRRGPAMGQGSRGYQDAQFAHHPLPQAPYPQAPPQDQYRQALPQDAGPRYASQVDHYHQQPSPSEMEGGHWLDYLQEDHYYEQEEEEYHLEEQHQEHQDYYAYEDYGEDHY